MGWFEGRTIFVGKPPLMSTFVPGHPQLRADHGLAYGLTIASLRTSESFLGHSFPHCKRPLLWPQTLYQLGRRVGEFNKLFPVVFLKKGFAKIPESVLQVIELPQQENVFFER